MSWSILDLTNKQYKENKLEAIRRYEAGEEPSYSDDSDNPSAGYGRVDEGGYFEYPLPVNPCTGEIDIPSFKEPEV